MIMGSRGFVSRRASVIGVACIILLAFVFHTALLQGLADFLIASDPLHKVDVIIVLSGDSTGTRVVRGVELLKQGYAKKMIMIGGSIEWKTQEAEIMERHAIHLGVSLDHILTVNQGESTYAQAKRLVGVMKDKGLKSAIVVTSNYHSKRTKYIFDAFFPKAGLEVMVCPCPSEQFQPASWWEDPEQVEILFYEYLKLPIYIFQSWGNTTKHPLRNTQQGNAAET